MSPAVDLHHQCCGALKRTSHNRMLPALPVTIVTMTSSDPYVQSPPTEDIAIMNLHSASSLSSDNNNEPSGNRTPSSTDLRARVTAPAPEWQPRSAEKILKPHRRMAWFDGHRDIKIDEKGLVDRDFCNHLRKSAICLQWVCYEQGEGGKPQSYEGQISVLRNPITRERKFLTANHNICSEENERGFWENCLPPHELITPFGKQARVNIPNTGWAKDKKFPPHKLRDGAKWSSGIDVSLGPDANIENIPNDISGRVLKALLDSVEPNDVVPDDFVYEVGMKVGMVAFSPSGPDVKRELENSGVKSEILVYHILGSKGETVVFTGEITFVGGPEDRHIEYDLNSRGGSSGGFVFVLEKSHPHFKKVLAVHVGHKPKLGSNIGFKLAGAFDRL